MKITYEILLIWCGINLLFLLVSKLYNLGDKSYSIITFIFFGGYITMLFVGFFISQRKVNIVTP